MIALLLVLACDPAPLAVRTLTPYENPFGAEQDQWAPQPHRDNPQEIVLTDDAAWVSLPGSVDEPGDSVARIDRVTGAIERIEVEGAGPTGLALHPGGRWLVVLTPFTNTATVIDVERRRVAHVLPMEFYAIEAAFTPDGGRLVVTNRWRDDAAIFDVEATARGLEATLVARVPVGVNPRDVAMTDDGRFAAVASLTGLGVTLIDVRAATAVAWVDLGAPANGLAFVGDRLVVATTSASTHHPALAGPDTDGDGRPGDSTPNVNFQDLGNDVAVVAVPSGEVLFRYVADTTCCRDYRDVDPRDAARHGDLLPPEATWIVGGALPEQVAADGDAVWITYSASDEMQRFAVDPATGALSPGPVWSTGGHNPHGIAARDGEVWVAHRLGETVGRYDAATGALLAKHDAGDLSGGPFPATDAEIGELFNFVTAPFTVDGDQSCTHCHREGGNIDKAFSMPLTRRPGMGRRMTMAYRGAADTRPWFFESAFDETNFKPVMNEFARIENFCCTDYTLWPDGAPADCAENPPPVCATASNAGSLDGFGADPAASVPYATARPTGAATRDAFYEERSAAVIGRTTSFGDGVFFEDPITLERRPVDLDFEGITRALGLFLLIEPRLLPNPNDPDTDAARRGRDLFERADVGCAPCHPAPTFAASTEVNPFGVPLRMGPVVTPDRDDEGINLDLFSTGFLDTFPRAEQDTCVEVCGEAACAEDPSVCDDLRDVYLGVTSVRGIWDRAPSMLHHGKAKGLREVLCTPGHAALKVGEVGFNERDGIPDTHGGTSHLTARDVEDLIAYLETL